MGEIIRKMREERGLTQEELGKLLGVERTTVTLWESGKNHPRLKTLAALAKVLHCRVDDLLCA